MEISTQWDDTVKVLKEKYCQARILYPANLFLKNEGNIKIFPEKQKQREFVASQPFIQEMLKEVL